MACQGVSIPSGHFTTVLMGTLRSPLRKDAPILVSLYHLIVVDPLVGNRVHMVCLSRLFD